MSRRNHLMSEMISILGIRAVVGFAVRSGGKMARPKRFELLTPRFVV
jgi:hypothetical protein